MSYSFGMFFKQCDSKAEAFDAAVNAAAAYYGAAESVLDGNKIYIPMNRCAYTKPDEMPTHEKIAWKNATQYWAYRLFEMRFIYWPQHKVLALSGYEYPEAVTKFFDKNHVGFQNSTDQDYEFEYWPQSITAIKELIEKYKNIKNFDELVKLYPAIADYDKEDIDDEYFEYYKRDALYDAIYKAFDLENWLWDKPSNKFIRFTINPIDSQEKEYSIDRKLETIMKEIIQL